MASFTNPLITTPLMLARPRARLALRTAHIARALGRSALIALPLRHIRGQRGVGPREPHQRFGCDVDGRGGCRPRRLRERLLHDANGGLHERADAGADTFTVQYDLEYLTAVSGSYFTVITNCTIFTAYIHFMYKQGSGFSWWNAGTAKTSYVTPAAWVTGATLRIRLDVHPNGSNTVFSAFYSTNQGQTWTSFGNDYTLATASVPPPLVMLYPSGTASTQTTGVHLGRLLVQDLPPTPPVVGKLRPNPVRVFRGKANWATTVAGTVSTTPNVASPKLRALISAIRPRTLSAGAITAQSGLVAWPPISRPRTRPANPTRPRTLSAGAITAQSGLVAWPPISRLRTRAANPIRPRSLPPSIALPQCYLYDTFGGQAGTTLNNHTADSGAAWVPGAINLSLDGNGFAYCTSSAAVYTNATMPSADTFTVQYDLEYLTAVSGSYFSVITNCTIFSVYVMFAYKQGSGFAWWNVGTPTTSYVTPAAWTTGQTLRIRLDVHPSGTNTVFSAYYSTNQGQTWTSFGNDYTLATASVPPPLVMLYPSGTGATATTGVHIGRLLVQNLPPTPPVVGKLRPNPVRVFRGKANWATTPPRTVTTTPNVVSPKLRALITAIQPRTLAAGAITAQPGLVAWPPISRPRTRPANPTRPRTLAAGAITAQPGLVAWPPISRPRTRPANPTRPTSLVPSVALPSSLYLCDTFGGNAGSALATHTSDSGATWQGAAGIALDGSGYVYCTTPTVAYTNALMPSADTFTVQYDLEYLTAVSGSYFTVITNCTIFTAYIHFMYLQGSGFSWWNVGTAKTSYVTPAAWVTGATLRIRLDVHPNGSNAIFSAFYSTNQGQTWTSFGNDYTLATAWYRPRS